MILTEFTRFFQQFDSKKNQEQSLVERLQSWSFLKETPAATQQVFLKLVSQNSENEAAIKHAGPKLVQLLELTPLPVKTLNEFINLWTTYKVSKVDDLGENIHKNVASMCALEISNPGLVTILLQEPFSIRFFARYNQADLLKNVEMFRKLSGKNAEILDTDLYQPKKTMLLTSTWYDQKGAANSPDLNEFFEKLQKAGIIPIIMEIDSVGHLLRSLSYLFKLNHHKPFAQNWIFRAHGKSDGRIQIGSTNEPGARIFPSAINAVVTEKIKTWFGSDPVKLLLISCYAGQNWVKALGEKLNWSIHGQTGSAGVGNYMHLINLKDELDDFSATFYNTVTSEIVGETRYHPKPQNE